MLTTEMNGSPVTLTQIQTQVFTPICSVCHNGVGPFLPGVMNLTNGNSYTSLVGAAGTGVPSIEVPSLDRIEPNDTLNSYLIQKIEGIAAVGTRMPQGGPALDPATIDMIKAWVDGGAADN